MHLPGGGEFLRAVASRIEHHDWAAEGRMRQRVKLQGRHSGRMAANCI